VVDIISELQSFGTNVEIYDPLADAAEVKHEYGLSLITQPNKKYHAIILTVSHNEFKQLDWNKIKSESTVVYDVKGFLDKSLITARL
jgi:UDP-N-acetyl-D-galactosamine dehydrogenase